MPLDTPLVSVVVLAYLDEPWLPRCVEAILTSTGVDVEVLLVDNGCTDGAVEQLDRRPAVRVLRPAHNLGFAGGCNLAASHARGSVLALVNSDAIVEPAALSRLVTALDEPGVGIVSASLRLDTDPTLINSAGNPITFYGVTWAGGCGRPAAAFTQPREVPVATGAALAMTTALWRQLGGFAEEYFAYHEDTELSWRCWQRGLRVVYVPDAVVIHRYEFSRNPRKLYLVERNRLIFLLTLFEARTLAVSLPALLAWEAAALLVAAVQGWAGQKVSGWRWLIAHRRWLAERRRQLQQERIVDDRSLLPLLSATVDRRSVPDTPGLGVANVVFGAYWWVARRLLARPADRAT